MTTRKKSARRVTAHSVAHEPPTTENLQRAFLDAYMLEGTVYHASLKAKIGRRTHYNWLEVDAAYVKAFEDAREQRADLLEREADRRAIEGWLEPAFYQGKVCGAVRKYSDMLLLARLRAEKPQKYRDHVEIGGPGGGSIPIAVTSVVFGGRYLPDGGLKTPEGQ